MLPTTQHLAGGHLVGVEGSGNPGLFSPCPQAWEAAKSEGRPILEESGCRARCYLSCKAVLFSVRVCTGTLGASAVAWDMQVWPLCVCMQPSLDQAGLCARPGRAG